MTKPHNPWEEFLNNCANGNNHFRSSEYQELIDFIDGIQAENAALKEQVAELQTVPMKYRRMAFNAQLQDENNELTRQLTSLQSKSAALEQALIKCTKAYSSSHVGQIVDEALAAFKGEK